MRYLVIPFLLWLSFFALFWNVKKWNWSVGKTILIGLGCSLGTSVVVGLLIWLVMIFD
jgi:hypothetical protein